MHVNGSTDAGDRPLSEREPEDREAVPYGDPLAAGGGSPYLAYGRIDLLLSLQRPRTDMPAELCFVVVWQIQELLFKLLREEFAAARDQLAADRVPDALWTLRRAVPAQRLLVDTWEVLRGIGPDEFAAFRAHFGGASGVQSFMYRRLEFVLGEKTARAIRAYADIPAIAAELAADLAAPSLYDAALGLLARRAGLVPPDHLNRDLTRPYEPRPEVERAWAAVYRPGGDGELRLMAETLCDVSYEFGRWRSVHLLVTERMIGGKPGSGASAGIAWLRQNADRRLFPELWRARDLL
ncbi:tryptophan 2,3-dioxygenase family protein [Nonomuraea sp. NPDC048916]|uniref:tryptophan 2,3-dioxygenase n=1 Tax=Nonomuraea sp. NPDC048916 TaxID=3154232 RepID=UPI0033F7DA8D